MKVTNGQVKLWHSNGQLEARCTYKDGKIIK
jgi:antitoxin component YwqK of YwqJK toxin-antitoxin module